MKDYTTCTVKKENAFCYDGKEPAIARHHRRVPAWRLTPSSRTPVTTSSTRGGAPENLQTRECKQIVHIGDCATWQEDDNCNS